MKFDILSAIIGLFFGIIITFLVMIGRESYFETGTMFDSATTTDEVQKIYDETVARLVNEANANIPEKNEGVDVSKVGEDLQAKIADVSAAAMKAFTRVAPKTPVAVSPAPETPAAPAPAPETPAAPAPQTSTYEVEPYH